MVSGPPFHHPEGFLDHIGTRVTGWARLPAEPDRRLRVAVVFSGPGAEPATVEAVADLHRADLEAAGRGDGRHGFDVPVPAAWTATRVAGGHAADGPMVEVWLPDCPGFRLPGSPRTLVRTLGPVTLRPARPTAGDLGRLRALLADLARLAGGDPDAAAPETAALAAWLGAADRCWLVAERRGRFVGHCRIAPEWPAAPDGLALGIEIHPDLRGFGLGRQLMLAARNWAAGRAAHLELSVLPHNARALALYRALGYADVGVAVQPGTGEPHRRMALPLPARRSPEGIVLIV